MALMGIPQIMGMCAYVRCLRYLKSFAASSLPSASAACLQLALWAALLPEPCGSGSPPGSQTRSPVLPSFLFAEFQVRISNHYLCYNIIC